VDEQLLACGSLCPQWFILLKNNNKSLPFMLVLGQPFIELSSVSSTNIYAMEQLRAKLAVAGTAFFAHEQTAGRGQKGRVWASESGQNIAMSLLLEPPLKDPSRGFPLSATIAMGCYDFYKNYAGDETSIKWPNDLYWRDRKAGGILIENVVRGNTWEWAVAGIGINVNQVSFDPSLPNPVSLKQVTGRHFQPAELARELCSAVDRRFRQLLNGHWLEIWGDYQQVLFGLGTLQSFRWEGKDFEAMIEGVNKEGEILLRSGDQLMHFVHGSIIWTGLGAASGR
jgi:BirA family transcriptional regulator, biotin operon repressor / biotin---[acetyl-CoA-carboxylase] ligase